MSLKLFYVIDKLKWLIIDNVRAGFFISGYLSWLAKFTVRYKSNNFKLEAKINALSVSYFVSKALVTSIHKAEQV